MVCKGNTFFLKNCTSFIENINTWIKEAKEIKELLKSGVSIIDIRTPAEWKNTGIIPKSNLLTFFDNSGNYNFDKWQKELKKIVSNNDPFVLICRSGRRSGIVANMISKESNAIIYDANGGINSWINADLKVIKP